MIQACPFMHVIMTEKLNQGDPPVDDSYPGSKDKKCQNSSNDDA